MTYGTLTVVCGPMYAGKTTEMLKRVLWAKNGQNRSVMVLKPAFDNRYAQTEIVSHDGLRTTAESVTELPIVTWYTSGPGLIVIDEVQFFTEPYVEGDVVEWVQRLLNAGHDVVAAGLDMDWRGTPFETTAKLLAMADTVIKTQANCTVCGRPAHKTFKKSGEGESVELGATDKYEARCNDHWNFKAGDAA